MQSKTAKENIKNNLSKINLGLDKTDKYLYNWFCSCGFSSSGRASPCQGEGSEFESRNPLQKQKGSIHCFLFLFFCCGMRDSKRPLFALQYKNSPQIITVCGVIFMPNYFLGTILSLPPIYIRSASGIETVPSALRLFSRNAISILGGATTVLLRV